MFSPHNQIMIKASETLIPLTLELGGKDAFIVCEDVDVEQYGNQPFIINE